MHGFDSFVIATSKVVRRKDIFRIIIMERKQTFVFTLFCVLRIDLLCDLDINLFVLPYGNKINFAIASFPHIDGVPPAAEFQVHNIFKAGSDAVLIVTKDAVSQSNIGKVEFLLRFQNFLSLQIVP